MRDGNQVLSYHLIHYDMRVSSATDVVSSFTSKETSCLPYLKAFNTNRCLEKEVLRGRIGK